MNYNLFNLLATGALLVVGTSATFAAETPMPAQSAVQAPDAVCKGFVSDDTGEPLIGASVRVENTNMASITDMDGFFSLGKIPMNSKIVVSYVGYKPFVTTWTGKDLKIVLEDASNTLDEVMVVAYGTQKKSSITGAISQVNADEIEVRPVSSVTAALEGSTSGITVSGNYGAPGESPTILIRGIGTVNGTTSPLYVIDGVPFGGNISDINPSDIESMSVLKDAASTALYGNRAANGVILITTKKAKEETVNIGIKINQGWYQRGIPEYDRVNAHQFMDVEYMNLYNAYISNNSVDRTDPEALVGAHAYVNENIIGTTLYMNPWDLPGDALYDSNGHFPTTAKMIGTYAEDLDWFGQSIRSGYRQEYLLNASGASAKSDYYLSVGYLDENGYMKDSGFSRLSGRANINISPKKWIKTGLNISATHQKYQNTKGVGDDDTAYANAFYFDRYMAPIYPVHIHDVNTGQYLLNDKGEKQYDPGYYKVTDADGTEQDIYTRNQYLNRNVIWENELCKNNTIRNTMAATAYLDIILPYGFVATIKGNISTRNYENSEYKSALIGDGVGRNGGLTKYLYNYKNYTFMQQLHWNRTFNDVHRFDVILGHENFDYYYDYTYNSKSNEAFPNVIALSNFSEMQSISGYRSGYRTESYLGRVQYGYNDRYNLEASIRRDGTSRLAKDTRWGTFGSVGANWIFSKEAFMEGVDWLQQGKLRADWGQVGQDVSSYYAYYALYSSTTNASRPGYYLSQNAANNLKWETAESWGIGLEAWMFDRWYLSVEYYDKRNKDLIFSVYAPISAGATSNSSIVSTTTENIGTISNRGWEINTNFDIYKNKNLTINLAANLTTLKNKVVKLPAQYAPTDDNPYGGYQSGQYHIAEGHSRYDFYTYHWAGVDMMDGQSLYDLDLYKYTITDAAGNVIGGHDVVNEDGTITHNVGTALEEANYRLVNGKYYTNNVSYAERQWSGNALPTVYGSFTPSVKWKGLSVSALFTYSLGGKIFDSNYRSLMTAGQAPANFHVDVLDSWNGIPAGMTETSADRINPNINPEVNYLTSSTNNAVCDRWLVSRNYFCLKNINVSYQLPKSLVRKADLNGAQIGIAAENLFLSSARKGMNPMMGIGGGQSNYLVPARVFTFSLSVNI